MRFSKVYKLFLKNKKDIAKTDKEIRAAKKRKANKKLLNT